MREKLRYRLYYGIFRTIALLPTPVLQWIGSGLRWLFEDVLKYRRKIIRDNLRNSFPGITEGEIREIEHDFYEQLADNFLETIKLLDISDAEVDRRIEVVGAELVDAAAEEGRPSIIYLGHYGNWEFVPSVVRKLTKVDISAQVYKRQHDRAFDRLMLKVRSRFGSVSVPQASIFRQMVRWYRDGKTVMCGFIADHRSNQHVSHHEMTFLNQPTQFNPGGEEIGKRMNAAYFYLDVEKPRRGHYRFTFKPIVPADMEEDSPYTRQYMRMLEETIRRRPGLWLWSHRRWKWNKLKVES
ncbi:MAG: lipd A biosynthesis protein [Duncaniella sp.]|nr:lipd A biosynthesis protein [Duncaniella sp.]